MVILLTFIFDAKMGGLTLIGKGKEIPQGDPNGIGIENRVADRFSLCLNKNQKHKRLKRNWKRARSEMNSEVIRTNQK